MKRVALTFVILLLLPFVLHAEGSDLEKATFITYQAMSAHFNGVYAEWSDALWYLAQRYNSEMMRTREVKHEHILGDRLWRLLRLYAEHTGEEHILDYNLYENLGRMSWVESRPEALWSFWSTSKDHFDSITHTANQYGAVSIEHYKGSTYMVWYVLR